MDIFEKTLNCGVDPIEIFYQNIIGTQFIKPIAYRGEVRVNSVEMGVLKPKDYIPVVSRNNQCVDLSLWGLTCACEKISSLTEKNLEFEFISVYYPVRMLNKVNGVAKLKKLFTDINFNQTPKLCLEISSEVLFEEREPVVNSIKQLKELGLKIMITGFGNEFCPVLRLLNLGADYVLLDEHIAKCFKTDDSTTPDSITTFAKECGCEIIADGVCDEDELNSAYRYNCIGAVGKISGRLKKNIK